VSLKLGNKYNEIKPVSNLEARFMAGLKDDLINIAISLSMKLNTASSNLGAII